MKTIRVSILGAALSALLLTVPSVLASVPPARPAEAPLIKSLKDLKKLDRRIVAMAGPSAAATVALVSKGGRGSGSGVVVSEDGIILTAAHVIAAMGDEIVVIFPDGARKPAKPLGANFDRDAGMAMITEAGSYPHVELGDSDSLVRNDWCIALGHPGGFDPTRTPPVRLGRVLRKGAFLITDSAVVGGDSGGPLFDADGRLIGIHSNIGAGLMENRHVPVSVYRDEWESMKRGKRTGSRFLKLANQLNANKPAMGVQLGEAAGKDWVPVEGVMDDSPAARAGLRKGDLITAIGGRKVTSRDELIRTVGRLKPGKTVAVGFRRDGADQEVEVKLARLGDLMKRHAGKPTPEDGKSAGSKETPEEDPGNGDGAPKDALDRFLDEQFNAGNGQLRLRFTPEDVKRFGGMSKILERIKERAADIAKKKTAAATSRAKEENGKAEDAQAPASDEGNGKKAGAADRDELKKRLAEALQSGRLQLTPKQLREYGGMQELQKLLREVLEDLHPHARMRFGLPGGEVDTFYNASIEAISPVTEKAAASTVRVHLDGKPVALGTVVSRGNWVVTKDTETRDGEVTVMIDGRQAPAELLKRFPTRDLALFRVDADNLKPVRWRRAKQELPVGSILTSPSEDGDPLGFGLLSVRTRALGGIGFLGIASGESGRGVLVSNVLKDSAASKAGLKAGDVITAVDGESCASPVDFGNRIRALKAGRAVALSVLRGKEELKLDVTLGERKSTRGGARFQAMNRMSGPLSKRSGGYPMAIQHDIPLPPSDCGGPLLDLKGRCVGINVSRAGRVKTFAIPARDLRDVLAEVRGRFSSPEKAGAPPTAAHRARHEILEMAGPAVDEFPGGPVGRIVSACRSPSLPE